MLVRERMSAPVVTIPSSTDLHAALQLMSTRRLRRLPVVDAEGRLVGVVTDRDLRLAAAHYVSSNVEIEEVMKQPVITVQADVPVVEAAGLMVLNKIGGLPVIDSEQRVIGIITESDIFRIFVDLFGGVEAVKDTLAREAGQS